MPKKAFQVFNKKVDKLVKLGRPKIAFGLNEPNEEILKSLKKGKKYADIILVGPEAIKKVKGFDLVIDNSPEERIASMLAKDEVKGIVRGTIDDFKTQEAYQRLTGEKSDFNPGLMEDPSGRQFFLCSVSNPEAWQKEEKLKVAKGVAGFIKEWGIEPKIAVFSGVRHETYPRKKHIREGITGFLNKTYEDAEWIVSELTKDGYRAKNWSIELDPAVYAGYNVLIPVNGMVGNQIFRALLFCGGKVLAGSRLGLSRPWEDNSRTERDFEFHIKWLVASINRRKSQKK